jgi:limonene-1,2-epoxide hydrolase
LQKPGGLNFKNFASLGDSVKLKSIFPASLLLLLIPGIGSVSAPNLSLNLFHKFEQKFIKMITTKNQPANDMKNIVLAFIKALNEEDFNAARKYLNDDMKFDGVLGSREGADVYIADMERMKFKYDIKKAFADGNDVCLLFEINMSGTKIFTCGWYHLDNGKISSLKAIFDPRPLFEKQDKK